MTDTPVVIPVLLHQQADGTYDKWPVCSDWTKHVCSQPCFGGSNAAGMRLDSVTVLDVDDPVALGWLLAKAWDLTHCISKTPRGFHLYFYGQVKQTSGAGWDLKHGNHSFVVTPTTGAAADAGYTWVNQGPLGDAQVLASIMPELHRQRKGYQDIDFSQIQQIVENPIGPGNRNNFLAALKGWLIGLNCPDDYVHLVVICANQAMPEPLSERELLTTVLRDKGWT